MFNLMEALPQILPKAIRWAEERSEEILGNEAALNSEEVLIAQNVGVSQPELIRYLIIDELPLPEDEELKQAALATGLLGPTMIGLTLGHGIYFCNKAKTMRLLAHECRHVYQYERAGSISNYLPSYLQQVAMHGYDNAPYEIDARNYEKVSYS